jgi:hypothetical protein
MTRTDPCRLGASPALNRRGGAPWDRSRNAAGDDPAYRRTVFGSGWGLLTFHVDDNAELIRIFDLTWIG